ncbi:Hypothetical_protein [Hexamita inflata]|uniref:Hypothetical_protein n=1 Tax=Hexamita inflata TaxID=28002 RepID=A0AA86RJI9_9EUKA|nr:Hypothetical protein HINF_LOCUS34149 [Hexamita inflata]CAI9973249.1 Hypothetical protein HINF_LOCUS60894 [Hexamita inflata]
MKQNSRHQVSKTQYGTIQLGKPTQILESPLFVIKKPQKLFIQSEIINTRSSSSVELPVLSPITKTQSKKVIETQEEIQAQIQKQLESQAQRQAIQYESDQIQQRIIDNVGRAPQNQMNEIMADPPQWLKRLCK